MSLFCFLPLLSSSFFLKEKSGKFSYFPYSNQSINRLFAHVSSSELIRTRLLVYILFLDICILYSQNTFPGLEKPLFSFFFAIYFNFNVYNCVIALKVFFKILLVCFYNK